MCAWCKKSHLWRHHGQGKSRRSSPSRLTAQDSTTQTYTHIHTHTYAHTWLGNAPSANSSTEEKDSVVDELNIDEADKWCIVIKATTITHFGYSSLYYGIYLFDSEWTFHARTHIHMRTCDDKAYERFDCICCSLQCAIRWLYIVCHNATELVSLRIANQIGTPVHIYHPNIYT